MKKGTWVKKNQPTIKICKSFYETKIKMLFFVDFSRHSNIFYQCFRKSEINSILHFFKSTCPKLLMR